MIQGVERDPLMRDPVLEKKPEPLKELTLYEGAHPVGRYALRAEDFGYVLVRGNHIVPVAAAAKPVLDACDGRTTLRQIERQFGPAALSLVGSLYQRDMIELI
jgi:hypothetical protein